MCTTHPWLLALVMAASAALAGTPALAAPKPATAPLPVTANAPPGARTVDTVDELFGLTLPDPYRWMEGQDNAEFQAWLKAQGEYSRRQLDALPSLAPWRERLQQANRATVFHGGFQRAGQRLFFLRMTSLGTVTLMLRDGDGKDRLLLDPATLAEGKGKAAIQSFAPAPDGRRVAINIDYSGGSEVSRIQVMDVDTRHWLADAIEPVWGEFAANWLPDGSGFAYTQMAPADEHPDGDPLQDMRVRLHRIGTAASDDPLLLRSGAGPGGNALLELQGNEMPFITFPRESGWAIASASGAQAEMKLCVAPRAAAMKPATPWHCLADYADGVHDFSLHGDTLYLLSVRDNPNGRVLALDLSQPSVTLKDAHVAVPTAADAVVTGVKVARDALYVTRMRNGIDELVRVEHASAATTPVVLPFAGSVRSLHAAPDADGMVFLLMGWTTPPISYASDSAGANLRDIGLGDNVPGDYSMLTSIETEAVSADGTRVPLSIIHRKDIQLDGGNRALVTGYGGYGMSEKPIFFPLLLEWVKAGNAYAVAHVRGGGEKGDAWHRDGQGANKHKGVEDFIACAGELARAGYTTPGRTALEGVSMGGVLVGGSITAHPDKFGAALVGVGMLNPVRLLAGANGANQIAEMGDPGTADGMHALAAMDPYQHIRPQTAYPAVLLQVGLKDSRVPGWHTGKFAARLRTATASNRPIWIRTDAEEGHGTNSLDAAALLLADQYAFLDEALPGR